MDNVTSNGANESSQSAVSWAAVIAGAVVASALSLVLLALGSGIGLGFMSPWPDHGASATSLGTLAIAWFIAIELFVSGVGGYIAGRLRKNWVDTHTDEVFFRDTAHGLLVWAVGTLLSAFLLAGFVSVAVKGAATVASSTAQATASTLPAAIAGGANGTDMVTYFSDMLFRSDQAPQDAADASNDKAEAGRIIGRALTSGNLGAGDQTYIAKIIVRQTGLTQADAEKRVADTITLAKAEAQQAADAARKAAETARKIGIHTALWTFIALLIGAFSASYMATVGGRLRDDLPAISS